MTAALLPSAQVDHLVIGARTLEQGIAWCEATLGVMPATGGKHPLMGTHNRLLAIASPAFPRAYLEIIAVDPTAPAPGRTRWFDLDDAHLQAALAGGPRLIHFVARTATAAAATKALLGLGIDRGPLLAAQRQTEAGLLQWQIGVRVDGQRLFYGGLPTLIEWGDSHPADSLPDSGVALQSLHMDHPRPDDLAANYEAIGLNGVALQAGAPNFCATLSTPRGAVVLESKGI